MKKSLFYVNLFLFLITFISGISYATTAKPWLNVFTVIVFCVATISTLIYVFVFKNVRSKVAAPLIGLGIIFALIANLYIVKNPTTFFILLTFSEAAMIGAIATNSNFSWWDILYAGVLIIPTILFVNLSPMFGFSGVLSRVVVTVFMSFAAGLFGLSIGHLIKKQNTFNILFTIITSFNLLLSLGLIILKQSNVTHQLIPIVEFVFYFVLCLFALSILFIDKEMIVKTQKSVKRNVIYSISIFLVAILAGYTIVSNFLSFNFVSGKIYKNQFMSMVENSLDIPLIEIYTQDNELPVNKQDYVNCSFTISNCENPDHNFSVEMAENYGDKNSVGIRLRGNSTMRARKQPYRIKFDKKQKFFDMEDEQKAKSWVLLADYYDQSYIRNYAAMSIAGEFDNMDFAPTGYHVALMINGEFKGLFLLCEQMNEKEGRTNLEDMEDIDIDNAIDFPFLVEMDVNAYLEGKTGVDNFYVDNVDNHVEIKYPEADERGATADSDKVYDYIEDYIMRVCDAIKEKDYDTFKTLVKEESAADYYIVNEIMMNIDSAYKSIYLHKHQDEEMEFGPVWDFDFSCTTELVAPFEKSYIEGSEDMYIAENSVIFKHLIQCEEFYNLVKTRYNEKKEVIINTYNMLKDYKQTIEEVADIDSKMWHGQTGNFQFDMQYDYVRLFLKDRYDYLNTAFSKTHTEFLALLTN